MGVIAQVARGLAVAALGFTSLVALTFYLVLSRRIGPFGAWPRAVRRVADPILAPIERRLSRAGRNPQDAPLWLFGFAVAVIIGFLFTAGRNWSGQPTPTGLPLALLALLWLAGRVLVLTPFGWVAAVVNAAFPIAAGIGLAIPLYRARNKRNYFFVAVLFAFGIAQFTLHLAQLGVLTLPGWVGVQVALDLMMFVMAVMGGRVIPMFTNNGVPGVQARRNEIARRARST